MKTTITEHITLIGNITMEDDVTESSATFMEEVESYMTYKVASFIDKYWFPVLIPIGLVGNTLSFLVMTKPNNRKMSTCIYMAAISINDNLMMCFVCYYWLVSGFSIHNWYLWECKLNAYFTIFSLQCATYQVLSMTVDKYIAIKWPHRAATYSTPRRARFIALEVFVCTLIYNVPILFVTSLIGDQCVAYAVGGTMTRLYSWISFTVNGIIPFSMLIYMNSVIVKTVRKSRTMFEGTVTSRKENDLNGNQETDTRQRTMKSAESQLTIMLLLVTLLFSILLIPTYIRFIYLAFVKNDTAFKSSVSILMFQVTHKLYASNSGVNFFLYCISGRKFRNDLKEILCSCRKSSHIRTETTKLKSESDVTNLST